MQNDFYDQDISWLYAFSASSSSFFFTILFLWSEKYEYCNHQPPTSFQTGIFEQKFIVRNMNTERKETEIGWTDVYVCVYIASKWKHANEVKYLCFGMYIS